MKCGPILLLGISLLGLLQPASSQQPADWSASHSFQTFRYENGLSDNFVTMVIQDSRGFLWVGTKEGLNRFDGSDFKHFFSGKNQLYSLPSDLVGSFCEYKKNHLLISTIDGLVTMNTLDQQIRPFQDSFLRKASLFSLSQDSHKMLWLALLNKLVCLDSNLHVVRTFALPAAVGIVKKVIRFTDGRVLISSDGLFFLDELSGTFSSLESTMPEALKIRLHASVFYDNKYHLLYVSMWEEGMYVLNFGNNQLRKFPAQISHVTSVIRKDSNTIWLGTDYGLIVYDEKLQRQTGIYQHRSNEFTSLSSNSVTCLYEDIEKNLWIGTAEGLNKVSTSALAFSYLKNEFAINGNFADIYAIKKGNDGNLYVATFGNGLFRVDVNSGVRNIDHQLIPHAWSITPDGNSLIITGHGQKIYRYYPEQDRKELLSILKPYRDSGDLVTFAFIDHQGGRWYSINMQMGLCYIKQGEKNIIHFSNSQKPAPFPHSYFIRAEEDKHNRIWFGMNKRSELVSFDLIRQQFEVHQIGKQSGNHLAGINCLLTDDSLIWSGMDGTGLACYSPNSKKVRVYTIEDGLSGNNVTSLVFDKNHRMWAGTTKGLSCLIPGSQRFTSFGFSDGLPDTYFEEGVLYFDSSRNKMYAGVRSTLLFFDPDELISSSKSIKPLHIDELIINGKKQSLASVGKLSLPYNQNNLQFNFTAIDFEKPGSIRYFHKLEGVDKDWIESGNLRNAGYANLREGSYHFFVKAIRSGTSDEMHATLPFTIVIQPPFWRTWWFRLLFITIGVAGIYLLIRMYYARKLKAERAAFERQRTIEQERTRIATDMHDDFGAGLSRINFLGQSLNHKDAQQEQVRSGLEKIILYSNEMAEKMGDIVWALNEKNDTLADLVAYTRSYALEYLASHDIACEVNTPLHLPETFIPGELRRNIFLSVKECLHNVIKHASASRVYFSIALNGHIEIIIHDNGKGIDWNKTRQFGNGMENIKKRMKDMKGHAEFQNKNGTQVRLEIPLRF